jgi:TIR domain-containing protein
MAESRNAELRNIDVFISYAHDDEPWASKFAGELKAQGVHAWFDKTDIVLGERWSEQLEQALREAPIVAVLLSPDYITRPSSAFEVGAAVGGNKKIIPIAMREKEQVTVPSFLRDWAVLQETSPEAAGKRVAAVVEDLSHQVAAEAD